MLDGRTDGGWVDGHWTNGRTDAEEERVDGRMNIGRMDVQVLKRRG